MQGLSSIESSKGHGRTKLSSILFEIPIETPKKTSIFFISFSCFYPLPLHNSQLCPDLQQPRQKDAILTPLFRRNFSPKFVEIYPPQRSRVHPEGFRVRLPAPEWFSRPNSHRFFESRSVCRSVCCCLALLLASFSPGRCRPGLERPGRLGSQTLSHTHARSRSLTHRGRKRQQTSFSAFSFSMSRPLGGESRQ